jgi:hypothetical protein
VVYTWSLEGLSVNHQVLRRYFLISYVVRGLKECRATHHMLEGKINFDSSWVSPEWPSSSVVEVPEPMLPWKIHHVILFASAVKNKKEDTGREGKEKEHVSPIIECDPF